MHGPVMKPFEYILERVDQVFAVWFARYRRRLGEARLRSAWRAAAYRASGYVLTWTVATFSLAACAIRWLQGSPLSREFASATMTVGVVLVTLVVVLLDRRWERFFSNPPALTDSESRRERLLVTLFRGLGVGSFILVAVAIIAVKEL